MKYIHLNTLFLMFVFHTSCGQNQTNSPQDNFSKEHNGYSESQLKELATSRVPMSQVRNIKQDRNGNILIAATWGGVFRYDARLNDEVGQGKSFTNLTNKLGYHRFWDVLEDRRGNLWFASLDSGVYYYPSASLRAGLPTGQAGLPTAQASLPTAQAGFQHFTTREGLANNAVMCIYEDKAGNIWFGTEGGGVSRYDARLNDSVGQGKSLPTGQAGLPTGQAGFQNFTTKEGFSNNITTIIEDKTGKLWFGAQIGHMFVYDPRLPDGQGKTFTVLKNKDGKGFNNVWSIIEDKKGNIWFGDNNGLWRYDGRTFTKVSQRGAYGIIEDKKGNIWTTGVVNPPIGKVWALSRYDAKSLYNKMPTVTEIKSGGIMDFMGILEANDGSIWLGSAGGVYRYDGKTFTDFKSKEGQQ